MSLTLASVRSAQTLIAPYVRRTPMMSVSDTSVLRGTCTLKLEALQVTGAFKIRGALVAALGGARTALMTASGGNHGLGVAFAAKTLGVPCAVVLPRSAPADKAKALVELGANVLRFGEVWDESWQHAEALAAENGARLIHPFADPDVLRGQATIGLEMAADAPHVRTWVIPIGGGGLIGGAAFALKSLDPGVRVVGVEPIGAPTLYNSREAGELVTLERIDTAAGTLAPKRSEAINFALVQQYVDDIVLVSDDDMVSAARWLWSDCAVAAELSAAAATAAVQTGRVVGENVGVIVCGRGTAGM